MTFRGGHRNIVTDGGKACPVRSPLSRLVLFLALLFSGLGFAASAQAQTATITWDEPVPVSAIGGPSGMLNSGDAVDVGTIVTFRIDILTGMTYRSPPSGCDISHDDGDTWRATITETCHVTIQTSAITMFAIGPTEVTIGENYTNNVIVSGGSSPFTFTLASGELPDGIRLSDRGTLSGAPREEGRFDFTIRATNEYGHFGTQFFTLTVLGADAAPTITNVSPSTGPAAGGTSVVITGTNLTDATAVTFGGAPAASFAVITDTAITATTEAHAEGPVDVAVTTPGGSATAAGAFTYDAPVVLSLSIDDATVVEGDSGSTFVTFNVTLDRTVPQFREVTFDIATADGTATAGVDYVALSGTGVSIGPGSIGRPVTVQILGDTLSEPNETFFVNVTNVVGAMVVDGQGVGTILDNDAPAAPTVSWSVSGGTSTNAIATAGGAPLSSGDSVTAGSIVEFLIAPANGGTYPEAPTGCGVQYISSGASGDLWRTGPITVDCAVSFTVRWVEILPPSQDGLAATRGQPYSVQFTVGNDYGPFTDWSWLRTLGVFPAGLSLDAATGLLSGTPEETGTFNFIVDVRNDVGHHNFSAYTLTVTDPIPTITGISPTTGSTEGGTSVVITGTDLTGATAVTFGGTAATSFTVDSTTQITATTQAHAEGAVDVVVTTHSGSATATGAFTYEVPASNDASLSNLSVSAGTLNPAFAPGTTGYTVSVPSAVSSLTLTPTAADTGATITVNGQSVTSGSASSGISLATGDTAITVVVTAQDRTTTRTYTVIVTRAEPTIIVGPNALPGGSVGSGYGPVTLTANGGTGPYGFEVTAGNLPAGLSLSIGGEFNGIPTVAGSFIFTVTATDNNGFTGTLEYTLAIDAPTITIGPDTLPGGSAGVAYGPVAMTADGGEAPYAFTVTTGDLPMGLSLATTGEISGMPTEAGSFTFTVTATDDNGFTGTREDTLAIDAPTISIDPDALAGGVAGSAYGPVAMTADGGTGPYGFEITAGNLPAGLSLATTGEITGTPNETGSFTFTVTATDDNGFTGTRAYTLAIGAPAIKIDPDSLADGTAGSAYGPVSLTADGGIEPYSFEVTAGDLPAGLSLGTDGKFAGTPTEAGSFAFNVTATDDNGFTGARGLSLSISAPEIEISVPPLPDGRVNAVYEMVQLSASGGTAPYRFAMTVGDLPDGIVVTASGALSGTPTEAGDFSARVTATDGLGFTGTANLSIKIRNLNVPVARDMTLEVMAGTNGSIDLTKGATNGPFTRADIAVYPGTEAGNASVRGDRAVYMLDFAAAGTFAGSASLQYTLSNADGRSAPATVTLNIIARPDPSQDPEVIGLLTAQAEAAKRFARTQTDNFNRRLEQLHDEGERRRNSMSVNIGLTQRDSDRAAYAEEDERDPVANAFRRLDGGKKKSETPASADYDPLGNFAVWSGGYVNFAESDNGSIDLDSTLVGISGGVDYRFTPKFVGGLGFGYGRDKTDVGGNGTESRGRAWSMAAYGSYKPTPEIFVDGLIGYGFMDFDSRRYVTATGDFATGSRGGQQVFGLLTAGYEHRQDHWLLSPYGRLEASRSKLDAFTENDGGIWGLTYGDQTIDTLSGVLGLRLEYALPMDWGVFKPRARLEYTHDFEGSSRASLGYADIGTLPYSIDIDQFSKDHLTIGLGFDAQIGDAWSLGFDYQTSYGSGGQSQDHTFAVKVGARF
ncbi:putative Ig domain-containing protein [Mesorhizobium sp. SB112]|uniref:putative Ig domain-containing protein n=1 Tax=Mesorhizobium sp. SB112 TaxID=3151853 RepID=UPI003264B147